MYPTCSSKQGTLKMTHIVFCMPIIGKIPSLDISFYVLKQYCCSSSLLVLFFCLLGWFFGLLLLFDWLGWFWWFGLVFGFWVFFCFGTAQRYVPPKADWDLWYQETLMIIASNRSLYIEYKLVLSSFRKCTRTSCTQRMEDVREGGFASILSLLLCLWCCLASHIPSSSESSSSPTHVITVKRM